jgi:hypothetical protein
MTEEAPEGTLSAAVWDANPYRKKIDLATQLNEVNTQTIELKGWTHVHTWHESHGEYEARIYQKDIPDDSWSRNPQVLEVFVYRDPREQTSLVLHAGISANDYLLAKKIRLNKDWRYVEEGVRYISPCYTAGSDVFHDTKTDRRYRIVSVAGHGEWASEIEEKE